MTAFGLNEKWEIQKRGALKLLFFIVIELVDEEFDVALKGDDVKNSITVEDLFNRVIEKL